MAHIDLVIRDVDEEDFEALDEAILELGYFVEVDDE